MRTAKKTATAILHLYRALLDELTPTERRSAVIIILLLVLGTLARLIANP